jgi:hypothetical protein
MSSLIDFFRKVVRLFERIEKLQNGLETLDREFRDLDRRVTVLEIREELLVEKTRAAAATAASGAVSAHLVDLARRIGALEAGQRGTERLPPP